MYNSVCERATNTSATPRIYSMCVKNPFCFFHNCTNWRHDSSAQRRACPVQCSIYKCCVWSRRVPGVMHLRSPPRRPSSCYYPPRPRPLFHHRHRHRPPPHPLPLPRFRSSSRLPIPSPSRPAGRDHFIPVRYTATHTRNRNESHDTDAKRAQTSVPKQLCITSESEASGNIPSISVSSSEETAKTSVDDAPPK